MLCLVTARIACLRSLNTKLIVSFEKGGADLCTLLQGQSFILSLYPITFALNNLLFHRLDCINVSSTGQEIDRDISKSFLFLPRVKDLSLFASCHAQRQTKIWTKHGKSNNFLSLSLSFSFLRIQSCLAQQNSNHSCALAQAQRRRCVCVSPFKTRAGVVFNEPSVFHYDPKHCRAAEEKGI